MRELKLLAAIAAFSLCGGAAVAQEKPVKPAKEKRICKGEQDSTSRIGKKVCKTKAEWEGSSGQQDMGEVQNKLRGMKGN
jgi:hypothetical protein